MTIDQALAGSLSHSCCLHLFSAFFFLFNSTAPQHNSIVTVPVLKKNNILIHIRHNFHENYKPKNRSYKKTKRKRFFEKIKRRMDSCDFSFSPFLCFVESIQDIISFSYEFLDVCEVFFSEQQFFLWTSRLFFHLFFHVIPFIIEFLKKMYPLESENYSVDELELQRSLRFAPALSVFSFLVLFLLGRDSHASLSLVLQSHAKELQNKKRKLVGMR